MKTTLLISASENRAALPVVIKSLGYQSDPDFEIIIIFREGQNIPESIDSSKLIQKISFVTATDVVRALNVAVKQASGEYLIFTAGDRVLHAKFIEEHKRLSDRDRIVAGSCISLGEKFSVSVEQDQDIFRLQKKIVNQPAKLKADGAIDLEEGIYINPHGLFGLIKPFRPLHKFDMHNMSFHRAVYEEIDGFDQDNVISDTLYKQFLSLGYSVISARNLAVQYKLREQTRSGVAC